MNQPQRKVTLTSLTPKPTTYKAKAFCNNCDSVVEGDFEFAVPLYSSPCPKCGCKHLTTMVAYRNRQRDGASLTSVSRNAIYSSPSLQRVDVDFSVAAERVAAYLRENPGALRQADSDMFRAQYQQEPPHRSLLSESGFRALRDAESPRVPEASSQRAADRQRQETQRLQREATRHDANYGTHGLAWDPAWQTPQSPNPRQTPAETQAAIDSVSPYRLNSQTGRTSSMPTYDAVMADAAVAASGILRPTSETNPSAFDAPVAGLSGSGDNMSIIGTPPDSPIPLFAASDCTSEQFERRVDAAASRRGAAYDALFEEMLQVIENSEHNGQRVFIADSANGIPDESDDDSPVVVGDSSSPGETDDEEEGEQEGGHANEQAPTEQ